MRPTRQETYALAQRLKYENPFWRVALLRTNGAKVIKGSLHPSDRNDPDAQRWHITMHGISGEGWSHKEALENWIWWAELHHRVDKTRRATDGRIDCPYSGQAPAPETLPIAEARTRPTLELAGGSSPGAL